MTNAEVQSIRNRAPHYLTPTVSRCANMSVADMQQFICHMFTPSDTQLRDLARAMNMRPGFQLVARS